MRPRQRNRREVPRRLRRVAPRGPVSMSAHRDRGRPRDRRPSPGVHAADAHLALFVDAPAVDAPLRALAATYRAELVEYDPAALEPSRLRSFHPSTRRPGPTTGGATSNSGRVSHRPSSLRRRFRRFVEATIPELPQVPLAAHRGLPARTRCGRLPRRALRGRPRHGLPGRPLRGHPRWPRPRLLRAHPESSLRQRSAKAT